MAVHVEHGTIDEAEPTVGAGEVLFQLKVPARPQCGAACDGLRRGYLAENIDPIAQIQAQLLNLLQDLQDEYGMSYLFISHDLAVVKYMADEVIVMNRGEIVESAGSDQIYAAPQHPYTKALLASMPRSLKGTEPREA